MPKILKPILLLIVFVGTLTNSCQRICGCFIPPAAKPFVFELIDKNGNSLVNSIADSVVASYQDNTNFGPGSNKTLLVPIIKNYTNPYPDTLNVSSKYNGLFLDGTGMRALSSTNTPVNSFNISVNGKNIGTLYINYTQYQSSYPNVIAAALTFNNLPAVYDHSTGTGLELLRLQ